MTTVSTPAPSGHPTAPSACSEAFAEALADYLFARDRLNSLPEDVTQEEEKVFDGAYGAADRKLIGTPAATIGDLRVKFDVLWSDPMSDPLDSQKLAIFADLRRLCGGEASPIFEPGNWLKWFERKGGMHCVQGEHVFLLQPPGADLADAMFELEAAGGEEAVKNLLRERSQAPEAA